MGIIISSFKWSSSDVSYDTDNDNEINDEIEWYDAEEDYYDYEIRKEYIWYEDYNVGAPVHVLAGNDGGEEAVVDGEQNEHYAGVAVDDLAGNDDGEEAVVDYEQEQKMNDVVQQYTKALMDMWSRSFTEQYVMSRKTVKDKLLRLIKKYYTQVYNKCHRKVDKKGGKEKAKVDSLRRLDKIWRLENDALLDIGRNMDLLTGNEKQFYEDQRNKREARLSEEIDVEFETEKQQKCDEFLQKELQVAAEHAFIHADDDIQYEVEHDSEYFSLEEFPCASSADDSIVCLNRSGLMRYHQNKVDASCQTDNPMPDRPALRVNLRSCTDNIKIACAKISSSEGLSVEKSRKVVKTV